MGPAANQPSSIPFVGDQGSQQSHPDAAGTNVHSRPRTYSDSQLHAYDPKRPPAFGGTVYLRKRRMSHDQKAVSAPRRFVIEVDETMRVLLDQEDTYRDFQISITDRGPKVLAVGTAPSNGINGYEIRGTYMLAILLQELALAHDHDRKRIILDESLLTETPVDRLSRMIKDIFWKSLTRHIDAEGLIASTLDLKDRSGQSNPQIYVPHGEPKMAEYYRQVAKDQPDMKLEVHVLPEKCDDPVYMKSLNSKPGILALAMDEVDDGKGGKTLKGIPFVVPGARFNELYNWDSYFITLGLIVDGKVSLAKGVVDHFIFEIKHYRKILNGNRTYYLCRSQPPFLTDLVLQIYRHLDNSDPQANLKWLKRGIQAAIKEYHTVWVTEPRMDPKTGLSRYRAEGLGVTPETEKTQFEILLTPYAAKHGLTIEEFTIKYDDGLIHEPDLDEYFMHDRAVRESGHDTTYRFDNQCGNLGTVDLQSLLYKYEMDIGTAIRDYFGDWFVLEEDFPLTPFPPTVEAYRDPHWERSISQVQRSDMWFARAKWRKELMDRYLWNEENGMYFDYDTVKGKQMSYESVTAFWPVWAGCAREEQARKLVSQSLSKFEVGGGLVSTTEKSRGPLSAERPARQWDYPYAWPPHQLMTWAGLSRYDYKEVAERLAYRFLYMMTTTFVDFGGIVPEKFDAVKVSHIVNAEYGNQGLDFRLIPREGFGWMNSAYQVGLTYLTTRSRRALAVCTKPEVLFG